MLRCESAMYELIAAIIVQAALDISSGVKINAYTANAFLEAANINVATRERIARSWYTENSDKGRKRRNRYLPS